MNVSDMLLDRNKILDRAKEIINGERQNEYGKPENSFGLISKFWRAFIEADPKRRLEDYDVAILMALMKIARIRGGTLKEDSFLDAIGYLALSYELCVEKERVVINDYTTQSA